MRKGLASLMIFAAALVWLGAVGVAIEQPPPTARPNIVLMLPDNLGWGEVNVYGGVRGAPRHHALDYRVLVRRQPAPRDGGRGADRRDRGPGSTTA